MSFTTKDYTYISMMTAIMCISAFISIPLPFTAVPLTFQVAAILMAGAVLGSKKALISVILYIAIGCIGIPVFSGMRGGVQVIFGATGGYIAGFIPAAFVIGFITERVKLPGIKRTVTLALSMTLGLLIIYTFGTIQLMILTKSGLFEALFLAVIPFIPLDIFKIVIAVMAASVISNIRIIE